MRLFLVKKDSKLHSLIWMLEPEEAVNLGEANGSILFEPEGIARLNAFIAAKDPYSLLNSINAFGKPMSHCEIGLDSSFSLDAMGLRRTYTPEEFLDEKNLDRYTKGSRTVLASECWFLVAGNGELSKEKESAARRAISVYGFGDKQELKDCAERCKNGGLIVVEPVLDWVWLKNMLVLMISLKHSLESDSAHPLIDCGFRKTSVTRFGAFKPLDSKYDAYVIPVAFNEYWRNTKALQLVGENIELFNPFKREGFLSWAPYSKLGFESIVDRSHRVIALKSDAENRERGIRYVSDNQVDGKPGSLKSFRDDWGGNLYLAITGNIENEKESARYFFNAIADSRIKYGFVDYDFALDLDRDGSFTAQTLESQLWLALFGRSGIYVGICENCGLPFLMKGKIRKRYCSHNCLQMAKKEQ